MADQTPIELLQPCLLDRLTDEQPDRKEESRRERVISDQKYRRGVLRDLEWLFNTYAFLRPGELGYLRGSAGGREGEAPIVDLKQYPYAWRSVLNFGLRNYWGSTVENTRLLEEELREALEVLEPRVRIRELTVRYAERGKEGGSSERSNLLTVVIEGDLWTNQQRAENLAISSTVDLETGQCLLGDAPHG